MLHIALCDDEADQLRLTRQTLQTYLLQRGTAAKVREFTSGQTLLDAMEEDGPLFWTSSCPRCPVLI